MMMTGAMPIIYLVSTYAAKHVAKIKILWGLQTDAGVIGIFGSLANSVVMFSLLDRMSPADKVINVAFTVCGSFVLADHLAYGAMYQPSLIVYVVVGKVVGGIAAVVFTQQLIIPHMDYFLPALPLALDSVKESNASPMHERDAEEGKEGSVIEIPASEGGHYEMLTITEEEEPSPSGLHTNSQTHECVNAMVDPRAQRLKRQLPSFYSKSVVQG